MNMTEAFLWMALGFAPNLAAMILAWSVAHKKAGIVARVVSWVASGKFFNKGVKALDSPHVGHVVRETEDTIAVFGGGDERYDVPKSAIKFVTGNVLGDARLYEIAKKFRVKRDAPLPSSKRDPWDTPGNVDLAADEKKYPLSLFNKGVRSRDEERPGHVMKETKDKIAVWAHYDWWFDLPNSVTITVGRDGCAGNKRSG